MISSNDKILSKELLDKGLIKKGQLDSAIKEVDKSAQPVTLASVLIKSGLMAEEKILEILSEKLNVPLISLKGMSIDKPVIDKVPLKFTTYYKFVPIKLESGVLTIAVSYPLDIKTQDEIRIHLGCAIEFVLAGESDILEMLKIHYGLAAETIQKIMLKTPQRQAAMFEAAEGRVVEDIEKLAGEASVIKLVSQIILEGHNRRATDIHLEPFRGKIKLRYRIDGVLYNAPVPPEIVHFFGSILSRIKIMSNLDIVERRLPQDGRAIVKIGEQTLDLRISFVPTPYGESVAIRILPTKMLLSLENLGLADSDLKIFENLVKKPHGIIFVTGPTGSGKTTTLYACLSRINTEEQKTITIEDPIEYELEGITQIQVLPAIGLDFARGLRSMLRHDPDVMMVGEVRDRETAEIAIRVALTGHLVFSTLHTNDAASGVTRLVDIGIEPYLVSSSVEAFIAQRLVRQLCPHCKAEDKNQPKQIIESIARDLNSSPTEIKLFKGVGCDKCNFTGFYGRTAIYEILLVDESIKEIIVKKPIASEVRKAALKRGMHALRQDGWKKVIEGITTPEEIMKVTQEEDDTVAAESFGFDYDKLETLRVRPEEEKPATGEQFTSTMPSAQQTDEAEKRIYRRLNTEVNVEYKIIKSKEKIAKKIESAEHFSITQNISAGGFLFISNESLPISVILELKIRLPDTGNAIECLGKVLRIEEAGANKYNIAVCFLDITSADRTRLNKYIEEELG